MLLALRHLLSILLLPVMAVVVMPWWLLHAFTDLNTRWTDGSITATIARVLAAAVLVIGVALFSWCVTLFARVGQGTLAPWDPTRHIVAIGPYRFVRNPMITGVALMLIGEALFTGSRLLGAWAALFIAINHVYFILSEEPGLERRFGASYEAYRGAVPRWVPRFSRHRSG